MYKFNVMAMVAIEKIATLEASEGFASEEVEHFIDSLYEHGTSLVREIRASGKEAGCNLEAEWLVEKLQMAEINFSDRRSKKIYEDIPF